MRFNFIKKYNKLYLISLLLISSFSVTAQLKLDTLGWIPPVDIPILLSGNFAELRAGHFHAGIDIKTQGEEGFKVYAVQDGYIARIKVSPAGYGKAIYINHPDGYTSVYAHLQGFNIQLEKYVRQKQYNKESFAVDLFPAKGELKVNQGDIIALSGNTGSSGGPHVHFEVRDTRNSHPLNGLFLGYDIVDTIAPKMYDLYTYAKTNKELNTYTDRSIYSLKKSNGKYKLKQGDTLNVNAEFGFGIKVNDYLNNSANRCGVYQLMMYVDDKLYFKSQFDGFSFAETRYINSLMDYGETKRIKRYLHKMFVDPNNRLSVYMESVNRGILELEQTAKVEIVAVDAYFNQSSLVFYANPVKKTKNKILAKNELFMNYKQSYKFDTLGLKLEFVKNSLYEDLALQINVDSVREEGTYSNKYSIHNKYTPIHKSFSINVACDPVLPELESKMLLAKKGKRDWGAVGGKFEDGTIKAKVRKFGEYAVMIDTTAPTIVPKGVLNSENGIIGTEVLTFLINDEFSGIAKYKGTVNGNWVLFQWDPKTRRLFYEPDEYLPLTGTFTIQLDVEDTKGNLTVFSREYSRNAPYRL